VDISQFDYKYIFQKYTHDEHTYPVGPVGDLHLKVYTPCRAYQKVKVPGFQGTLILYGHMSWSYYSENIKKHQATQAVNMAFFW